MTAALVTTFDRTAQAAPEALLARAASLFERTGGGARLRLVLDAHLSGDRLAALIELVDKRRDEVDMLAVEDPSGLSRAPALAALDREESRAAIAAAEATLRRAASLGAPYAVLRLGWVEGARRDWTHARDRWLRARWPVDLQRGLVAARDRAAHVQIDRARAALDRLSRTGEALAVTLLVKNGQRYVELPSANELDRLRADLRGAPIVPLFDLPAAHLADAMGLAPLPLVEAAFGGGPLVYGGDACGALAALAPGDGAMGRAAITAILGRQKDATVVFRPWAGLGDREIIRALQRL